MGQAVQVQTTGGRVGCKSISFTQRLILDDDQTVNITLEHVVLLNVLSQPQLVLHPTANAPPVWACLHSPYNNRAIQGCPVAQPWRISSEVPPVHWWTRPLKNFWGTCFVLWPLPAGCTRAAQSPVHVPHLENSVLKPQLEPLPSSWQAFSSLEKKAIVLTKWLSDTTASHLIWSARLVNHLLLWVEMCLESVATACPKCPVTVMPAPASLTAVQATAQLQHNLTYEQAWWAEEGELAQLITQVCACSLLS